MRIDLHTHSTASDGTDTPAELVRAAAAAGVDVVAVTDHDTTAGWDEALAARPEGLVVVPGAEFSCRYHGDDGRTVGVHLLGYLFDPHHPALVTEQERLRESRLDRARRMVELMAADGLRVSWPMVSELAAGGTVGRPHIARALVAAGHAVDVDAAFATHASSRAPYYVRKADTDLPRAIGLIRDAGGVAVMAHPRATRRGPVVPDEAFAALVDAGLNGVEVAHPDQDHQDRAAAAELARRFGLLATGSSDYHGTNKTRNELGVCTTPSEVFARMLAIDTALRPIG